MTEQWFCIDPKECMCGGDTRAVRQTCSNYRSLRVDLDPTRVLNPALVPDPAPERPTLRDQFAIAALPDLVALNLAASEQEIAAMAYRQADAMMKERGS
jgi:hypothetical protein